MLYPIRLVFVLRNRRRDQVPSRSAIDTVINLTINARSTRAIPPKFEGNIVVANGIDRRVSLANIGRIEDAKPIRCRKRTAKDIVCLTINAHGMQIIARGIAVKSLRRGIGNRVGKWETQTDQRSRSMAKATKTTHTPDAFARQMSPVMAA